MACRKECLSKKEANKILGEAKRYGRKDKIPKRAYHCPKCKAWHLTSVNIKKKQKLKAPMVILKGSGWAGKNE